jgi:hypothetical protein
MYEKGQFSQCSILQNGKQEFFRTDFGSRLLAAEGAVRVRGVSEVKQYPSGSG